MCCERNFGPQADSRSGVPCGRSAGGRLASCHQPVCQPILHFALDTTYRTRPDLHPPGKLPACLHAVDGRAAEAGHPTNRRQTKLVATDGTFHDLKPLIEVAMSCGGSPRMYGIYCN